MKIYDRTCTCVYAHIYAHTENVFNIKIYGGGAHAFIYGECIDGKERCFSKGRVFSLDSPVCPYLCASITSRSGIFLAVTLPELTKENQSCKRGA